MTAQVTAFLGAATALGDYFARFEKQEVAGELQSIRREIEALTKEAALKDSLLKDHKELVEVRKTKQMLRSTESRFARKLNGLRVPRSYHLHRILYFARVISNVRVHARELARASTTAPVDTQFWITILKLFFGNC
jgi:hypothetical protein